MKHGEISSWSTSSAFLIFYSKQHNQGANPVRLCVSMGEIQLSVSLKVRSALGTIKLQRHLKNRGTTAIVFV